MTISQPTIDAQATLFEKLRSTEYQRLDDGGHVYLDYTGGGLFAASQLREHVRAARRAPCSATRTRSTRPRRRAPSSSSAPGPPSSRSSTRRRTSTSPSSRPTRPARCASWARRILPPRRPLPADLRQPQLGQRDPRVRARPRGGADVRPERRARPARRRGPLAALSERDLAASPQPVRVPRAVQLLRRAASAGVDRRGALARLGRAARRRRVRADQPARPQPLASRLRRAVVLQDVRLSDRRRVPDRTARGAREARASVVLGRDHRRRVRRAAVPPGRRPARRTSKTAPSTTSTSRRWRSAFGIWTASASTPSTRASPRSAARCWTGWCRCATPTARRRRRSTGRGPGSGEARPSLSTSCIPTVAWSTSATSTASPRRHNVSLRTGCFCNPGAGEVAFTISRETLLGGEFGDGMTLDDYMEVIGLPTGGAVRASLGIASNSRDVQRFLVFASEFIDLPDAPEDLPPRVAC